MCRRKRRDSRRSLENMVMEKTKPQRNTYHGIVTTEINLPITSAPEDNVPRFIRFLPTQ